MKTIFTSFVLIVTFCLINISNAKAQFVTISDSNFATWLNTNYPNCMNGNLMDTTCADITNETKIEFTDNPFNIQAMNGLQYFDSAKVLKLNPFASNGTLQYIEAFPPKLTKLNLGGAYLSNLPALPQTIDTLILVGNNFGSNAFFWTYPPNLKYLDFSQCQLNTLPALPEGLLHLNIHGNQNIGQNWTAPSTLNYLDFTGCQTQGIPLLPPSLETLFCGNNNLGSAVWSIQSLPQTLKYFYCSNNNLTYFTELPPNLNTLECSYNAIDSFPPLPNSLYLLQCQYNSLDTIILPPTFQFLNCSHNDISYIQGSSWLTYLDCSFNNLTQLPNTSPSLYYLFFNDNQVTCLPELDPYFFSQIGNYFNADNNPIYCVPNYVPAMGADFIANHPLCIAGDTINNPNNCDYAQTIIGKTYIDTDTNCVFTNNDLNLENIKVNLYNLITDDFNFTYSFNGIFNMPLELGTYIISIDTTGLPYTSFCNFPALDTMVTVSNADPIVDNLNFSLQCKNGVDLEARNAIVTNGLVFPGQEHRTRVYVGDMSQNYGLNCAANVSGTITIDYSGPVTFVNSQYGVIPNVSGNTLTYQVANFANVSSFIDLTFITDTTAQADELVCLNVSISSPNVETNNNNNNQTFCYRTVNSYDPNIKLVYPKNVEPGYEDWFTYTIYFQNLGNAPAFNIRILDTLDNNLRHETFQLTAYSHLNNVTLNNGILTVRFPNIMLPDSASNPEGSIGFIQYRIKPISNLPAGSEIKNTAHIYFDFNPAIVTNTTVNEYETTVNTIAKNEGKELKIFPNPSNGVFYFGSNTKVKSLEVFDYLGNRILQKTNANNFDLSDFSNGIYFVRINGNQYSKVIKN